MGIKMIKMIAHYMDIDRDDPDLFDKLLNLKEVPIKAIDFFSKHIENALVTKQIKSCVFLDENADVLMSVNEIVGNINEDDIFITETQNMTELLFKFIKSTASRSSGTLIFILYKENGKEFLGILKMDPNEGIQLDLKNYKINIQEDMLPTVNERLHKCAFVKITQNLFQEDIHLFVLDKQQSGGEVSKFFMRNFLNAKEKLNDKLMTDLVSQSLSVYARDEAIVASQSEILEFNKKVDDMLQNGRQVDLDRDLEGLFSSYDMGHADVEDKIDRFKHYIRGKDENVNFQFLVEKKAKVVFLSDPSNKIKVQFPITMQGNKVKITYEENNDGHKDTVIRISGTELK